MAEKEYIEREAAKEFLVQDYAYAAAKLLDYVPAAAVVEERHGEWRYEGKYKACSLCGSFVEWDTLGMSWWDYCPNCGAKMDGKGESNG